MMPRKREILKKRVVVLPEWCIRYFETGDTGHGADFFAYAASKGEKLTALWAIYREKLLPGWIERTPCTRPWYWWCSDAPRELVPWCQGWEYYAMQPHRKRLGGTSEPSHCAHTEKGMLTADDMNWLSFDPADPPTFESQAAYLDRHGLLSAEEKRHLKKHPELLEPEAVVFEVRTKKRMNRRPERLCEPVSGAGPYQTIDPK